MRGSEEIRRSGGFTTVSGILSTRPEMIRELDRRIPALKIITTKSYQLAPNPGNREPVIVESAPGCFGNAVGLRNPGMEIGLKELSKLRESHAMRAKLNVSLSGNSPEEFVLLARGFSAVADSLELNFSCPHAEPGYGMSIGVEPELVTRYVRAVRQVSDLPLFPKLSPNVKDIAAPALAAMEAGADGIVAINTVGPELYIEPHSGKPILMNIHGGKGGKSGRWIFEEALEKVAALRRALGPDVLIIGMGGVEDAESVRAMRQAGADVIGIGSAFALVKPAEWEQWFDELSGSTGTTVSLSTVKKIEERQMEYRPFSIISTEDGPGGLRRITLDGSLEYESGQFVFLWIPGIGEKPFSVALPDPLTFLVRERGPMTRALCRLEAGDQLYIRGVYGEGASLADTDRAWILAGGTGIAVAPRLAMALKEKGKEVCTYLALADSAEAEEAPSLTPLFEKELSSCGICNAVFDSGEIGRAIRLFSEQVKELSEHGSGKIGSLYTIGPLPFMDAAARAAREAGMAAEHIQISIETPTRCGVGLCGECACAGKLTCREGTFFSLKELEERGVSLSECGDDH
jgi:dihydroorotate dehydrogenase subfamily 1